jgi:hypothetical protein
MKRCWIHVGMHKTGTTSVQVNLSKSKMPRGWRFLSVGGSANMGQSLYAMFATEPHKFHWFIKRGQSAEEVAREGARLRKRFAKVISKGKNRNIIISGEALSLVDKAGIEALHEFIKPLCDEVRIIGYIRPPVGFIVSIFQQQVKHGNGEFNVLNIRPRYRRRFEKFDEVFGKENVILSKFDATSFPNQCIVADFCQKVGLKSSELKVLERANESLSREACGILYAYHKFGPGYGTGEDVVKENLRLIRALCLMPGAKFKVSSEQIKLNLAQDKNDIQWMEERLGVSLRESVQDDGTEVSNEEDLLQIKKSALEEFVNKFTGLHGLSIPVEKIPSGKGIDNLVDPREVAIFVDYCRSLARNMMRTQRAARQRRRKIGRLIKICSNFLGRFVSGNSRAKA